MREQPAPVLLSGGNPQIAKGNGPEVVEQYLAAMPGWKQAVGRRLDALIVDALPGLHRMVKWNSPFYGPDYSSWFVSFHCMTRYIKVAFPQGTALDPVPPGKSKQKSVRYLDIPESGAFDEALFTRWIEQASRLPAERF
ncbi:DUF1801 domain-containing protein [Devosia sp. PTR5]|jgi:hypothetical protein|uniref:DUF1801 domain-containing protein n=1 Tax=Devosia oryzisoli TaxID=2774138 RepID=A0A927IUE0_9HYPH|nr:DUF1801 domain-containing protein [Devosia oryzisoli]MBD8066631.1 DUF1801 domain-containing protein [Devosia oryzisoli]